MMDAPFIFNSRHTGHNICIRLDMALFRQCCEAMKANDPAQRGSRHACEHGLATKLFLVGTRRLDFEALLELSSRYSRFSVP